MSRTLLSDCRRADLVVVSKLCKRVSHLSNLRIEGVMVAHRPLRTLAYKRIELQQEINARRPFTLCWQGDLSLGDVARASTSSNNSGLTESRWGMPPMRDALCPKARD